MASASALFLPPRWHRVDDMAPPRPEVTLASQACLGGGAVVAMIRLGELRPNTSRRRILPTYKDPAALSAKIGARAEPAHGLAYRLYTILERRKWAREAPRYNVLVRRRLETSRLVRESGMRRANQPTLFGGGEA